MKEKELILLRGLMSWVLLAVCATVGSSAEIRWVRNAQQAVDLAHQSGRMIIVSVGANWCHFCKKMDRETWRDAEVVRYIERYFVPLKLHDETHPDLIRSLEVSAFPTTLIYTSDRRLVARIEGYQSAREMLDALHRARTMIAQRRPPHPSR